MIQFTFSFSFLINANFSFLFLLLALCSFSIHSSNYLLSFHSKNDYLYSIDLNLPYFDFFDFDQFPPFQHSFFLNLDRVSKRHYIDQKNFQWESHFCLQTLQSHSGLIDLSLYDLIYPYLYHVFCHQICFEVDCHYDSLYHQS